MHHKQRGRNAPKPKQKGNDQMKNMKIKIDDDLFFSITQHDTGETETAFVDGSKYLTFRTSEVMPEIDDDVMRYQRPIDIAHCIERGLLFANKIVYPDQIETGAV
jgi:hypothetical protein